MQRLEVSGAARPIYGSLRVKRLTTHRNAWQQHYSEHQGRSQTNNSKKSLDIPTNSPVAQHRDRG